MLKNYVLGAEIASKGGFHIANISMLFKDLPLVEGVDYLKYGGITLLSKNSLKYPKYIRNIMFSNKMTDLSELVPLNYFKDILENNITLIKKDYKIVQVENKKFVKIINDKLKKIIINEKFTKSVVGNEELEDLIKEDIVLGYIPISKDKSLTWY